jgi:hypothetical protein|nr:hypothetical protein [Kofleriaceae bacterium]
MSELAFNINGEAFEVPANASGWRVRKMRAKGSPEVVYAREGQPLVLPISAEIADLRAEVDSTGRYRLDLVDQNNRPIDGAPSGYVQINFETQPTVSEAPSTAKTALATQSDHIVLEAMRMQSMIAVSVVERFPQMMEAAATLLRAADGAGLPARPPLAAERDDNEEEDDDSDAPTPAPAFDVNTLIAQLVPVIIAGFATGKLKLPNLGAIFDWRKASGVNEPAGNHKPARADGPVDAVPSKNAVPENANDVLPPIDPSTMAHFVAVQSALTPEERAIASEVAAGLTAAELRAWFAELSKLSVPDSVARIRNLIAGQAKTGGGS